MAMGVTSSSDKRNQRRVSRAIDKKLSPQPVPVIKLLLLGPGESGKSTILKQMRIIHDDGYTEAELRERRPIVLINTVDAVSAILLAMHELDIPFERRSLERDVQLLADMQRSDVRGEPFSPLQLAALKRLWADAGVQRCFERRNEFQLSDCAHFLNALDRIGANDYMPTVQDVLMMRMPTTSVSETVFRLNRVFWRVFDVGGQRTERRKWLHHFDDVNAIIFIAAVSEYDQKLFEDNKTNRLHDAITLFQLICNSTYFVATSMVLFLNKKDLFEAKIRKTPITVLFNDYKGEQTYEASLAFIRRKFEKKNLTPELKKIYCHETCATDTDQVEVVLHNVTDMIIVENLKESGAD